MDGVGTSEDVFGFKDLQLPDILEDPIGHLFLAVPSGHQGFGHPPSGGMPPTLPLLVSGVFFPVTSWLQSPTPRPVAQETGGHLALWTQRCLSGTSVGVGPVMEITGQDILGADPHRSAGISQESPSGNFPACHPVAFPWQNIRLGLRTVLLVCRCQSSFLLKQLFQASLTLRSHPDTQA